MDTEVQERTKKCHNEKGAGRASTSGIEHGREVILSDRRVTLDDAANISQLSKGSVHAIIKDKLGFRNVFVITNSRTRMRKIFKTLSCQ